MTAKIFISHSSGDQKVAKTICTALEHRGLVCWMASRDVGPGQNYMDAIVRAIRDAKVMVLVFSQNANISSEILKELSLASKYKVNVIPARIEDVVPSEAFELEFATRQWIDLFEDWEHEIDRLTAWIISIAPVQPVTSAATPSPQEPQEIRAAEAGTAAGRPETARAEMERAQREALTAASVQSTSAQRAEANHTESATEVPEPASSVGARDRSRPEISDTPTAPNKAAEAARPNRRVMLIGGLAAAVVGGLGLYLVMSLAKPPVSFDLKATAPAATQIQQIRGKLVRVWHGHYICAQGIMGVDLSLTQLTDKGTVSGVFSFFSMPGMSNARSGKFSVTGNYDRNANILQISPVEWIDQPAGYVAIGFFGSPNDSLSHIEGSVTGAPGCTKIFLD